MAGSSPSTWTHSGRPPRGVRRRTVMDAGSGKAPGALPQDQAGDLFVMTGNYGAGADRQPETCRRASSNCTTLRWPPPTPRDVSTPVPGLRPFTTRTATTMAKTTSRTTISDRQGRSLSPAWAWSSGQARTACSTCSIRTQPRFGQGSNFAVLKQPPIFYTYFPGFGIDASVVHNLDHLYDREDTSPACRRRRSGRARRMARCCSAGARTSTCARGKSTRSGKVTFFAKSAETASAGVGGIGGMPGGAAGPLVKRRAAEHRDRLGPRTDLGRRQQAVVPGSCAPTTRRISIRCPTRTGRPG